MKKLLTASLLIVLLFGCKETKKATSGVFTMDTICLFCDIEPVFVNGHRQHYQGMTYCTYPPYYSCALCGSCFSPADHVPDSFNLITRKWIMPNNNGGSDTLNVSVGYGMFCKYLEERGVNEDSFFFAQWNIEDTSCISTELERNKSYDIWQNFKNTHKGGRYWLTKYVAMSTDGFMYQYEEPDTTSWKMAYGGRLNDSFIMRDKWYKIIYE